MSEVKNSELWDKMNDFRQEIFGKWPAVSIILHVFQLVLYASWLILRRIVPGLFRWVMAGVLIIPGIFSHAGQGFIVECYGCPQKWLTW